jgi:hypothetical protein
MRPAAGRPDFVPWVLGKQQSTVDSQTKANQVMPRPPSQDPLSAVALRQMSRDLGAVPQQPAVLSALANLGLPTPAVTAAGQKAAGASGKAAARGHAHAHASSSDTGDQVSKCCCCFCYLLQDQSCTISASCLF